MAGNVQFRTNGGALAQRKRLLASEVRGNLRSAAKAHAEKMKATAVQLSSGTLTPADRRAMGYPYAVRFAPGAAGQPDYLVNSVSGDLKGSWRTRVQETSRGWTITVKNSSPEAKFLMSTRFMRYRGILDEVNRRCAAGLPLEVKKVCRRACRDNAGTAPVAGSNWGGFVYGVGVGFASATDGIGAALGR